ncbi:MAG: hypothetical protein ACTSYM_07360 [Candidatus Baldrarchaeia archaeon]
MKETIAWFAAPAALSVLSIVIFWSLPFPAKLYALVPITYTLSTTIIARNISLKQPHTSKSLKTLLFIPLTLIYIIVFEACFNVHRLLEPGFLQQHMQYHIFNDLLIFIAMFLAAWFTFRKFGPSKQTIIITYILGAIFEAFFAGESGSGPGGLIMGLLWIWILHINWFLTLKTTKIL